KTMIEVVGILMVSLILAYIILLVYLRLIPYSWVERLQTYAPAWIPRKVLFGCLPCTSFWIVVILVVLIGAIHGILTIFMHVNIWNIEYLYVPFIVSSMIKVMEDFR